MLASFANIYIARAMFLLLLTKTDSGSQKHENTCIIIFSSILLFFLKTLCSEMCMYLYINAIQLILKHEK